MQSSTRIFTIKQSLPAKEGPWLSSMGRNDLCFFRFSGGNMSETDIMSEQLYEVKSTGALVIGIFRFPFRFEGKKRLQTAILQYHRMKELCHAVTYIHADGMLEMLGEDVSLEEAYQVFDVLEEGPVRSVEDLIHITGQMNIDVRDIQTFLQASSGPVYIRTFEGDTFDEPLKYVLNAPYLPIDYTEGSQILMNIGCSKDVHMQAFQQMSLRLNDLFHKCELFKLGTYFLDEPGSRFKITLMVNGIKDPYPRPVPMRKFNVPRRWIKRHWTSLFTRDQHVHTLPHRDLRAKL